MAIFNSYVSLPEGSLVLRNFRPPIAQPGWNPHEVHLTVEVLGHLRGLKLRQQTPGALATR
jgi:hypothetical protein